MRLVQKPCHMRHVGLFLLFRIRREVAALGQPGKHFLAQRETLRRKRIVRVQVVRQPGGQDVDGTRVAVYPHRLAIVQTGADDVG